MAKAGTAEEVRGTWEEAAAGYAKWDTQLSAGLTGPNAIMFEMAGLALDQHILDLACGTGGQTVLAADLLGPAGKIVAVDISATMLEHSRQQMARAGHKNVEFVESPAEDLPLADSMFDAAICRLGVMLFPDPESGLASVIRVLKPGARLAALVFSTPDRNLYMARSMEILRAHAGKPPPPPRQPGVFALGEPGCMEGLLAGAGFAEVEIRIATSNLKLESAAEALQIMRQAFGAFRAVISELGEAEQEAAWSEVGDYLAGLEGPEGFEAERTFIVASGAKPG